AAFHLIGDAVRVDDLADVDRHHQSTHADIGLALDLRHHGAIGAEVLVAPKADAMPGAVPLAPRAPAGALGGGLQHSMGARIFEMAQAEGEWVLAALRRQ